MPRKYKKQKGGNCAENSVHAETCSQGVDVSSYTQPCGSLPLDNAFVNQKGGDCTKGTTDCLGNNVIQLGQNPLNPNYPTANNLSEHSFSSRYFAGKTARGGGYYPGVEFARIGGLPEIVSYADCNAPVNAPKEFGQVVKPGFTNVQKGGAYLKIVNPETGRKVSIFGKIGKRVLKNYIMLGGGNQAAMSDAYSGKPSDFNPNMSERQFGCKQPEWEPTCV